jgi:hypothetical protein
MKKGGRAAVQEEEEEETAAAAATALQGAFGRKVLIRVMMTVTVAGSRRCLGRWIRVSLRILTPGKAAPVTPHTPSLVQHHQLATV